MQTCEQMPELTVLAHGEMVHSYFIDLQNHVTGNSPLQYQWRLPDWCADKKMWSKLSPDRIIKEYMIHHDCSKPIVRIFGDDGRVHFPNHAAESERLWLEAGGDPGAARLMGMDMDIHLLKAEGQVEFSARPEAATLLIAGLCEIHANASMFGGIDSTSFKIKWKSLDKRGRQICKLI